MRLSREELLMKLGAARQKTPTAWRLVAIDVSPNSAAFSYRLDRNKLRVARRREGRYLLRTNLTEHDPANLPSGSAADRSPHLHRVSRLLPARHAEAALARARPRAHPTQRNREVRRHADDRRPRANHRWTRIAAHPLHPARSRADLAARQTQARTARPAVTENHRHGRRFSVQPVVPTFRAAPATYQSLSAFAPLQSAKSGRSRGLR